MRACRIKVSPSTRNSSEPAKSPRISRRTGVIFEYHVLSWDSTVSIGGGLPSSGGGLEAMKDSGQLLGMCVRS